MKYLNTLRNQWLSAKAWMLSTFVFMFFSIYLLKVIVESSQNVPVRMVTYEWVANNGHVRVDASGMGDKAEYLTSIASADVTNYANWTHRSVNRQMSRFVNRMSPRLYSEVGPRLLADADRKSKTEESQALFIERVSVRDSTVRLSGVLRMYVGTQLTRTVNMSYQIQYVSDNGVPYIMDFKAVEGRDFEVANK